MNKRKGLQPERMVFLAVLLATFVVGGVFFWALRERVAGESLTSFHRMPASDVMLDIAADEVRDLARRVVDPETFCAQGGMCFSSEPRVVAIGSAYPIPYDAEVCPFSGVPQPTLNQLDRDGDGLTDDWELHFGLDSKNPRDASGDGDADGFTNLEEFKAGTDPVDGNSHPASILKWRLAKVKTKPFAFTFGGVVDLPDGREVFQLNRVDGRGSVFAEVGDNIDGVLVKSFIPGEDSQSIRLVLERKGIEIVLPRGEEVIDPENEAELINVLDQSVMIANMGALLSIQCEVYTVVSIGVDKMIVRRKADGEMFEVIGFSEEERPRFSEGLK